MPSLTKSALHERSRICHSTGNSVILGRTGKAPRLCRGARDVQLQIFHRMGLIAAPTDKAWADKWREMQSRVAMFNRRPQATALSRIRE